MSKSSEVKLLLCAIQEYVKRTGGHMIFENGHIEIILPIIIEETPGGVQFKITGKIVGKEVIVEDCEALVESESHNIKPVDLTSWANYVNERFSYACQET